MGELVSTLSRGVGGELGFVVHQTIRHCRKNAWEGGCFVCGVGGGVSSIGGLRRSGLSDVFGIGGRSGGGGLGDSDGGVRRRGGNRVGCACAWYMLLVASSTTSTTST